jgi:hypothetical protein
MEHEARGAHEWVIEFEREPADLERFVAALDDGLRAVNSDYDAKRRGGMALQAPRVHTVPQGTFYQWMKGRNKLGGQNKVPRLCNDRVLLDELLAATLA